MQNKTFETIKENKLFAWTNPAFTSKLKIDQKKFLSYKEGCIIYRINDESNYLFLVVEGEVKLKNYHYEPGKSDQVIIKIKNDFFGEKEIIYRRPRSSVAVASSDCILYGLSINDLPRYLIRKLYYLNNAAFPEQEYPSKEIIPEAKDSEKAFPGSGKSRFLRVEAPGKMQFYKELQKMPIHNLTAFKNERFAVLENKSAEDQGNKKSIGYEYKNPDEMISTSYNDEYFDEKDIYEKKLTGFNNTADSAADEDLKSGIRKIAESFIKIGSSANKISSLLLESAYLLHCQKCDLFISNTADNELIRWMPSSKHGVKFKIGLAITGLAAERREILFSNNIKCDPRFIPEYEGIEGTEINSLLCFPLFNGENNLLAVLRFANKLDGEFSIKDQKFLNLFSPFFSSIIERKITESEEKGNKSSALSKIVSEIKYDLIENFHTIKTCSNMLYKMDLGAGVNRILENMHAQADSGEEYLLSLTEFVRGNFSSEPVNEDINAILDYSLKTLAKFAETKNIKLLKKFNAEGLVFADKKKFRQACFHIIKNFCRAMPAGGKIYIKTENLEENIKVEFRDSRTVIQQAGDKNIFDSIAASGNNGTGIELSIPEYIIKSIGGSFKINNLSQGASVTISLPVNEKLTGPNRQPK
ncbi:MAG: cyclic nucleotide-binding domain-containing protein [Ignavibacteria bacterium]